jgi:hypothetical protein
MIMSQINPAALALAVYSWSGDGRDHSRGDDLGSFHDQQDNDQGGGKIRAKKSILHSQAPPGNVSVIWTRMLR